MTAALLCPGPSLAYVVPSDVAGYTFCLAINRAAIRFQASHWCSLDYPMIRDHRRLVLGNPVLMTHQTTWHDIQGKVAPFPSVVLLEDIEAWYGNQFQRRTMPAAMLLAGYLGATRIDIYGDDKTPEPDFDGIANAETMAARGPERWDSERRDYDAITDWLAGRGVEVKRVDHVCEL